MKRIKKDFPILQKKMNGKDLVYLDSAATSMKPSIVIKTLQEFYENYNANVQRGIYRLSQEATEKHEEARTKIAKFIGAKEKEIIFTRNATESMNLLMHAFALPNLKKYDEIVSSVMEHHSNILPWQFWSKISGGKLSFVDIKSDGALKMSDYSKLINKKTKLVTITHASNVLGTINEVKEIAKIAHDNGAVIHVDGAQSVPHMPVNVKKIGADFLSVSGHKMLGPTGIGFLYVSEKAQENMEPFMFGGEMNKHVNLKDAIWNDAPYKWEAGTPAIAEAVALGAAVDYLNKIGMKQIREHEESLVAYALKKLGEVEGLQLFGPRDITTRGAVFSFLLDGIHSHDIAQILDKEGIAVRSGRMCAEPLLKRLSVSNVARASFYLYNDKEDVDKLIAGLQKVRSVFKLG